MKTLKGTEKQIKWAESIRNKAVEIYNEIYSKSANKEMVDKFFNAYIFNNDSAGWWIDHRDYVACDIHSTMGFLDWCLKNQK
ncbi:MAG: hypothetical protein J6A59_05615 [Lachnospiraceae bacterium]|nr:hypothetical protein [Lachnospiraceae bacterium]MBO5407496.1 hypothetical protein [Bacteroidales bacterium]